MSGVLLAVAGPWQGQVFKLSGETSIGRLPGNGLTLEDNSVSRQHCVVFQSANGYRLRDSGSANPTRLNGSPVLEALLVPGDEIEIGRSLFRFQNVPELNEREAAASFEDETGLFETVVLAPADQKQPDEAAALQALLDLAGALPRQASTAELLNVLLPRLVDLTGGDRAACFELSEPPHCLGSTGSPLVASRTLLRRAWESRAPVSGVAKGGIDPASRSLMLSRAEAAMAAPMPADSFADVLLYVEKSEGEFDEQALRMLGAVAQLASSAFTACVRGEQLEEENRRLRAGSLAVQMVGRSTRMQDVLQFITRASRSDSTTVLIEGESGTGKELIARAIHGASERARGPLVAVNCAALTETLLESELFGHEKGAFTGAISTRKGRFEEASGGTFFLDEVGEMSAAIQAKVLRVLQEREFQRVGGSRLIKVDVRVIAATNRDLQEEVKARNFRADLLYRLRVLSIRVPALRERPDDIAPLAEHFLRKHATLIKRPIRRITPEAMRLLRLHTWPGNVRELENAIERAVVMAEDEALRPEDFAEIAAVPAEETDDAPAGTGVRDWHSRLVDAKRRIVREAFGEAGGEHNEAARLLGIHPNNLRRLLRSLSM